MCSSNSLFSITAIIASLLSPMPSANADLVVSEDLGVLAAGSSTTISGDTATGANNCDTYTLTGVANSFIWENEIVFQFTVNEAMRIDITSVALNGDPDVFLLNSLETEINEDGLLTTDALNLLFLDNDPPESVVIGTLPPGTYYISVESYGGDATFSYNLIATAGAFPDDVTELGTIAEANAPFTIDTIGNTIDTEIAVWTEFGILYDENDDANFDLDGDGFADIYQSQINFTGLSAGTYYVAVGSYDTIWGPLTFVGGDEGGTLTLNYGPTPVGVVEPTPAENSVTGELTIGGVLWYSFEIGESTPPTPSAPLRITKVTRNVNGQMNFSFNSSAGSEYAIDISTDMSEWQELTDGLVGEAETTTYSHTSPDRAARTLFYRVRQLSAAPLE